MRLMTHLLTLSWEFLITLDYEWSVIRGHRPYRWTIWVGHYLFWFHDTSPDAGRQTHFRLFDRFTSFPVWPPLQL